MIENSLNDNLWISGQRLTKERKQLRNELLKRLCVKINADLKHLFENNTFPSNVSGVNILYKNCNDESQEMTFNCNNMYDITVTYRGSKINIDGAYTFTYEVNRLWCEIYLSNDNRLYLPIRKTTTQRFSECDRIYIDEFIKF